MSDEPRRGRPRARGRRFGGVGERELLEAELATLSARPLVSVVMPTYESDPGLLGAAIDSVIAQVYPSWELCIADDGSADPQVRETIERRARSDPRIRADFAAENAGISAATNRAIGLGSGELVAFCDHDDVLDPAALLRAVGEFVSRPQTDVVYSDEDKLDASGRAADPFLKPDFSPVYALGAMYLGHLLVVRRGLLESVGGLDSRFDTVQDFELGLRISEQTDEIVHIPEVLYHWRAVPGSIAAGAMEKPEAGVLQTEAVSGHLRRRKIPAHPAPHPSIAHRTRIVADPGARMPSVSIVVVAEEGEERLRRCLDSILEHSDRSLIELIVVAEPGEHPLDPAWEALRVERAPGPVRPAVARNAGAAAAGGDLIVFCGESVEVTAEGWLSEMALFAQMPGVGAVGPVLRRPDGRVAQAGFAVGLYDPVSPAHAGEPADGDGYYGSLCCAREVSAAECRVHDDRAVPLLRDRRFSRGVPIPVRRLRPLPVPAGARPDARLRPGPGRRQPSEGR